MRKLAVIALVFMGAKIAAAQIPTSGNIFFGYSYYNTSLNGNRNSLNGWEGSIEGKFLPLIGIVAAPAADLAWRGIVGRGAERMTLTDQSKRTAIRTRPRSAPVIAR